MIGLIATALLFVTIGIALSPLVVAMVIRWDNRKLNRYAGRPARSDR